MSFEKQTREIRACCKELLERDEVDVILGYTAGGLDGLLIPYFARTPEEAERVEWGDRCYQHLAGYLHGRGDRVGIVAKPCDVRAIIQLVIEQQVHRDRVHIIGVDCGGMVDAEGNPRPGCAECRVHTPPLCDTHVTDERIVQIEAGGGVETGDDLACNLEKFQNEIDKCILCYSCRQACYGCYCATCFMQRDLPDWQPAEIDTGSKMTYHLGRAMHLAGRCVECGSCEAACASGVNIRYIIWELTDFIEETYDYRTGMDPEATPCMVTYAPNDREIGFLGGGEHE